MLLFLVAVFGGQFGFLLLKKMIFNSCLAFQCLLFSYGGYLAATVGLFVCRQFGGWIR